MTTRQDKKIEKTEERIEAVEHVFTRTEQFIEANQNIILIVVGVIVVVVLGFFGFKRFYMAPKEKEAQGQMFMAEKYFEMDSLNKALNGDGQYLGFLGIIDEYGITKSADLAQYYAGICYLKLGQYENAIDYLKKFDSDDEIAAPMAKGAIGDAYMELNETDKGIQYYLDAADMRKNDFTAPMFLMKAGLAYDISGKPEKALEMYKRVKKEFPRSFDAREIDKYISYTEAKLNKE